MDNLVSEVVARLRRVVGPRDEPVPLHVPCFRGNEMRYVGECITTGWVSSVGSFVDRFEAELAAFTGGVKAVAVVNGTCALQLALKLVGVIPGDEVIIPSLSFVATANAVAHVGAIPHFVDSEERTLGLDPDKLADHLSKATEVRDDVCVNCGTGRRIAAVVPMHAFGHPVRMRALLEVANRHRLPVVEDAAESLGSYYTGIHTGLLGRAGIVSFNGNKTITTGGGGAILTQDAELAVRAKHLSSTAKCPHRWEMAHDEIAFNFRMPNINAALGCAQLEQLPELLRRKRSLAGLYAAAFADLHGVGFVTEPDETRSNYWLSTLLLTKRTAALRDELLAATHGSGFLTRPVWTPLSELPMYRTCPRSDLSTTLSLAGRIINLPSSPSLCR